jgi:hypothetical protein
MRQSHIVAAVVFATLAAAGTASAQTRPDAQSNPAATQPAPALSSKPYLRLFDQQLRHVSTATRRIEVRPDSARRFMCTMPILPADSALDPKFETPLHTTTRFSMRVVDPGDCH